MLYHHLRAGDYPRVALNFSHLHQRLAGTLYQLINQYKFALINYNKIFRSFKSDFILHYIIQHNFRNFINYINLFYKL